MKRSRRLIAIPAGLYLCWLGMMIVHEAGHRLHARVSGAIVERTSIPLFGFSQTFYVDNDDPKFVAWGGPIWGCLIPLAILVVAQALPKRVRQCAQFFAGFCLIANGAYLGIGWTSDIGDAGDLLNNGTPVWMMITFGVVAFASGLYLWHHLGSSTAAGPAHDA